MSSVDGVLLEIFHISAIVSQVVVNKKTQNGGFKFSQSIYLYTAVQINRFNYSCECGENKCHDAVFQWDTSLVKLMKC